jgi:hypothetical protein
MKRLGLRLSRRHRLTLYCVSLLLFISGAAWAWARHLDEAGHASSTFQELKPSFLTVHGISAVAFMLLLGTLLPGHVCRSWLARKNRANGASFLTATSFLTLSGYALYYLGDEAWRNAASGFHLWLGLAAPVFLFLHVRTGRHSNK